MPGLQSALPPLRARIAKSLGKRAMNEQNTKATLVEPVLRALGWDTEDIDEVVHEYKRRPSDDPVDYALLSQRTPRLFIEAKALGEDLAGHKWAKQILGYASVAGVEWIVLTNGDEWRIYNAHASVAVEEKLFRTVRISAEDPLAEETLALLAKEQWDPKRIEALWQLQFVDRKVRIAIEEMFATEPDNGLVNAVRKRCPKLAPKDIRASLSRARVSLDYPQVSVASGGAKISTKRVKVGKRKPFTETSGISQQDLIASGVIKAPLALERTYKGQTLRATLSMDGRILVGSQAFDSFSAAGGRAMQIVLGCPKPPACPGWDFWRYRDQHGKLVPVDALRQQFLKSRAKP